MFISTFSLSLSLSLSLLPPSLCSPQPLINAMLTLILKTPHQGAQTTIYCAVAEELEGVSGRYFEDCQEKELERDYVKVKDTEERLWQVSAKMVGLSET